MLESLAADRAAASTYSLHAVYSATREDDTTFIFGLFLSDAANGSDFARVPIFGGHLAVR